MHGNKRICPILGIDDKRAFARRQDLLDVKHLSSQEASAVSRAHRRRVLSNARAAQLIFQLVHMADVDQSALHICSLSVYK